MTSDTETNTMSQDMVETQTETTTAPDAMTPSVTTIDEPSVQTVSDMPHRPAWVEIDLVRLGRNFQIINRDKPPGVQFLSVAKDDAYGHGAYQVLNIALAEGAAAVALSTLEEAVRLRERGIRSRTI